MLENWLNLLVFTVVFGWKYCHGESDSSEEEEGVTGTLLKWYQVGYASESVEYDAINKQYYFANYPIANSISIMDGCDIDAIMAGTANIEQDAFDFGQYPLQRPRGMWTDGKTLYVNDGGGAGRVLMLDIESRQVVDIITVYYDEENNILADLNGMCHDPTNDDILYVTDVGVDFTTYSSNLRGNLYRIDLLTKNYEKLYDFSLYNKDINFNGCIFNNDGILFAIERRIDSETPLLLEYNPNELAFKSYEMPYSGDGLTINKNGNYLFYSEPRSEYIHRIKKNKNDEWVYDGVLISGLNGAGDICFNYDENWIIAPNWPLALNPDGLYFIQITENDQD